MADRLLFVLLLVSILSGCGSTPERRPLPPDLTDQAVIPDIPRARFWGDEWPSYSSEEFWNFTPAEFQRHFAGVYNKPHNYLAISGGGANGAFGAGLLVGWTASGRRPEFTMVTGISTGALTAPFAFLGPEYDDELKAVYTTTTTKHITHERSIIRAVFRDAFRDSSPLRDMLERYITSDIIEAIAREHRRGRRLFVGTVNLDAARSVIWNIGAIADSDSPRKLRLIHKILQASAAIPVLFPPVAIRVEVDGEIYDELHVDGGTGSQVFVYPATMDWGKIARQLRVKGEPKVYVIRNALLDHKYQAVERGVLPIANRSIYALIRTQGIGDLCQIYSLCKRDGNDFNLAYIPPEFTEEPAEIFDSVYMGKLFDLGYELALKGYDWKKQPPGFVHFTQ